VTPEVDGSWLEEILVTLLQTDTQVPMGQTEIQPGDPKITSAVDGVIMPMIHELEPDEIRQHPMGDLAVRFGPEGDDGLLLQTYVVSQHANLMEGNAGDVVNGETLGLSGRSVLGQGASQNKGPMASAFSAVRSRPPDLRKPIWLTVNTEGRSSHGGSGRVIEDLGATGSSGVVAFGTDLGVSVGNRGRVDIIVRVKGASAHSSQPWLGMNPIEAAADAIVATRTVPLPDRDSDLGPATATPYQFACHPIAPHTIPDEARVVVDRRLLPGELPETAVVELRDHLRSAGVNGFDIDAGMSMLPASVDLDSPVVVALLEGLRNAARRPAQTFWSLNAFDAGYACSKGIPTPMFGPGKRRFSGEGLVGSDAVALGDCAAATAVLAHAIDRLCT
jgi:succinyl-diaminopimelate desuccinylase